MSNNLNQGVSDEFRAFLTDMTQSGKDMNGSYWIPRAVKLLESLTAAVAAPSVLPAELSNAFITLESDGGEGRTIVLKFNQRDDAYAVHHFLMTGALSAAPTAAAATTSEDARDAALYRWLRDQAIYQQEVSDGWYEIKVEAPLQDDVEVTAEQFDMQVRAAMRATQQEGGNA